MQVSKIIIASYTISQTISEGGGYAVKRHDMNATINGEDLESFMDESYT